MTECQELRMRSLDVLFQIRITDFILLYNFHIFYVYVLGQYGVQRIQMMSLWA